MTRFRRGDLVKDSGIFVDNIHYISDYKEEDGFYVARVWINGLRTPHAAICFELLTSILREENDV